MIKNYWTFLKNYLLIKKSWFIFILILAMAQCLLNIGIPIYYKIIIDNAVVNMNKTLFFQMIVCMVVSFLLIAVLGIQKDYYQSKLSETMAKKIRIQLNCKISHIYYSRLEDYNFSDIISRYSKEVEIIKENAGKYFIKIFSNILTIIFSSVMIIMLDWRILIASVIVIYLYIKINSYFGKRLKQYSEKIMNKNNDAINILTENYTNILIIKILELYKFVHERFRKKYEEQYNAQVAFDLNCSANINLGLLIIQLLGCVIWGVGGFAIFEGHSSIGSIMAIVNYQSMLLSPINFLCQFNSSFQAAYTAINRVMEILNLPDEQSEDLSNIKNINEISVENLCFAYKNRDTIIENMNAKFKKGEIVALMGPSGCGKSTFLKLILGLYKCDDGCIKYNNQTVSLSNIIAMRKYISYVGPESTFFEGTLKENMFLENTDSMEKIETLSYKFGLDKEIHDLPLGWDTSVTSGGNNLSTGQKRRLDFVRTFVQDRNVIIFDEPTASLDIERREKFYEYLQSIKKNKIIIVVTHNTDESIYFDKIIRFNSK